MWVYVCEPIPDHLRKQQALFKDSHLSVSEPVIFKRTENQRLPV